jgi:hypothetical protein
VFATSGFAPCLQQVEKLRTGLMGVQALLGHASAAAVSDIEQEVSNTVQTLVSQIRKHRLALLGTKTGGLQAQQGPMIAPAVDQPAAAPRRPAAIPPTPAGSEAVGPSLPCGLLSLQLQHMQAERAALHLQLSQSSAPLPACNPPLCSI